MVNYKELVLSNVIGVNPTGTLDFAGTFSMNGTNNLVRDPQSAAKDNLEKTQKNEIICNNVEKFQNLSMEMESTTFVVSESTFWSIKNIFLLLLLCFCFIILWKI